MRPRRFPIVTAGRGIDPVEGRLVKSLASPGGNLTGVALVSTELGGKRLELVKEAVPKMPVSRFSTIPPFRPVSLR